ncbi:LysR family transcriptional regulator [Microbacteriaceae bacterium K1510]|nr:LysR family transcriptional regulator [Microbacteriaceae bacterium K1510]
MSRLKSMSRTLVEDGLLYLSHAARLGTMRAASDLFDVSPSTISRQIASLEKEFGIDLVEKNRHVVKLTEAGRRVLTYYRDQQAQRETLLSDIDDLKGLRTGHVVIAVGQGLIRIPLVASIQEFNRRFPRMTLSVRNVASRDVVQLVYEDVVHFGAILDASPDPRVRTRSTSKQPLLFITRADHPLASRRSLPVTKLIDQKLVLPQEGFRVREILGVIQQRLGIVLDMVVTASSIQMLTDCVLSGVGSTIIPVDCVSDHIKAGRLVAVPIQDADLSAAQLHIIVRVGRRLPSNALALLEILEKKLAS